MIFVLEVYNREGDDSDSSPFLTLRGATSAGCRVLKKVWKRDFNGYLYADRFEGPYNGRRHVVAEWKDGGRVLAKVWQ